MTTPQPTDNPPPDPAPPWHALPVEQVLARLACDPASGLSEADIAQRRAQGGENTLPEPPRRSTLAIIARQFKSPLIYILFVAAVLAIALSHYGDAVVILLVVLANALIGAFQEGRAERSMASLRRLSALHVRVLRGGHEMAIEARELVTGDVLLLAAGDAVGADARLIEAAQLQVAEAALTGESVPVSKAVPALPDETGLADRHNMVFSGTYATAGR
ncbi:MAG: cation-transporting P-type ATPase, partial [Polaromonas sp.]